ncbi:hypothetical protein PS1_019882 [Malus domestica]
MKADQVPPKARLPFPMHIQKEFPTHLHLHLGLKTLIFPEATTNPDPHVIHNHKPSLHSPSISRTSSLSSSVLMDSSSSWSSSTMDDLIGTESGAPILSNEEQEKLGLLNNQDKRKATTKKSERIMIKTEYPPPIPLLAQTGNLQGRMPWVLTKHYNYSDGRLVLKGERVKHHEYFEALRENGRLILNLVPLDNNAIICCEHQETIHEEEDVEKEDLFVDEEDHGEQIEIKKCFKESDSEDDDEDECDHSYVDEAHYHDHVQKKAMDIVMGYNSVRRSTSFCDAQINIHEHQQIYLDHPASAPLRPMTTVM